MIGYDIIILNTRRKGSISRYSSRLFCSHALSDPIVDSVRLLPKRAECFRLPTEDANLSFVGRLFQAASRA